MAKASMKTNKSFKWKILLDVTNIESSRLHSSCIDVCGESYVTFEAKLSWHQGKYKLEWLGADGRSEIWKLSHMCWGIWSIHINYLLNMFHYKLII